MASTTAMPVEPVEVRGLRPVPVPLSRAVRAGHLLFVSGTSGRDPVTGRWGDAEAQIVGALRNLDTILREGGSGRTGVVSVTAYLRDAARFESFSEHYAAFFGSHRPARTTIVAELVVPEMYLELSCVAVVDR